MKRALSDYLLDFEPEDLDSERTAKMSRRPPHSPDTSGGPYYGGDYIPGLGQRYQNQSSSSTNRARPGQANSLHSIAGTGDAARASGQYYSGFDLEALDRQSAPVAIPNRADDVFASYTGMFSTGSPMLSSGNAGLAQGPMTLPASTSHYGTTGYQAQSTRNQPWESAFNPASPTSSASNLASYPQYQQANTPTNTDRGDNNAHPGLPLNPFELGIKIGGLEADLRRERDRVSHLELEAKRYKKERDDYRKALADLQAETAMSGAPLSSSRNTNYGNPFMSTPQGHPSTVTTPWNSSTSAATQSTSGGISTTPSREMSVTIRPAMHLPNNSNQVARFGIMPDGALLNDIFQKVEYWAANHATLPLGSEAEGDQARSLIAGAIRICGQDAFEDIMNGPTTRKHLVAAFINRVFVNDVFTVHSARKASSPQYSEMVAMHETLQNTDDQDIHERARIVAKVAEAYANITGAKSYQYARERMTAAVTADLTTQLNPLVPPARRSVAFDQLLSLVNFTLRAAERFHSAPYEWVFTFENTGSRFDIHTMVQRDERLHGDPRLLIDGHFRVTLGISPAVTRRSVSSGTVVTESLQKPQVLITETQPLTQRAVSQALSEGASK